MAQHWDDEVDVLVAGTGAAALSAAITAQDRGESVLIVESTATWGGTTSWSGGGVWAPNNSLAKKDGFQDSPEEALTYMETVIADVGPASSRARKEAFVAAIPAVVDLLAAKGVKWVRSRAYPDYYPEKPGGKIGRSLEVKPFNVKKLGAAWDDANAQLGGIPAAVMTDDVYELSRAWSTPSGFVRGARLVFRVLGGLVTGRKLRGMGSAISSALYKIVLDAKIPVRLRTPLTELIVEDGVVVGAVVTQGGEPRRIRARHGVVLGAGGFAHRTEWREQYQGVPGWSSAPAGDLGTAIEAGQAVGGALAMMDDAWWGSAVVGPDGAPAFVLWERSLPHSFVVDQQGERFVNESTSYIDFGHAILEHNKNVPAIPAWLVTDSRHARRYLFSALLTGKKPFLEAGILVEADTLEELATMMGVPAPKLAATVERFNGFAATGVDEDFGRGDTAYDRYYSDPTRKPNPNLGAVAKGPFRAIKVHPGDLGTKGGLLTDEHARVLREDGTVVEGLYAAGNTTASVMGGTYPGAGATLGPALAFGYLAALHAAGRARSGSVTAAEPDARPA